jgi:membrane-associated phospholipid phosphatase
MVDALIHGREGTADPNDSTRYGPELDNKTVDHADALERWEPWVRAYTAIGDALQGIVFDFKDADKEMSVCFATASGADAKSQTIATIGRPTRETFCKQLPLVLSWAELREERATEIMAQIDPTYAFWSSVLYLHPTRTRWTFELINVVLQFCVYVEMRFKHALGCWRPVEYNAQVQPMITTPGHGAFPSGHCTQSFAVAYVLGQLLKLDKNFGLPPGGGGAKVRAQLDLQAARIATNRVVAGVHFPADSMAGRMLGTALGEFFVARAGAAPSFKERKFRSAYLNLNPGLDFNPYDAQQHLDTGTADKLYQLVDTHNVPAAGSLPGSPAPVLQKMWAKATEEWQGHFGYL